MVIYFFEYYIQWPLGMYWKIQIIFMHFSQGRANSRANMYTCYIYIHVNHHMVEEAQGRCGFLLGVLWIGIKKMSDPSWSWMPSWCIKFLSRSQKTERKKTNLVIYKAVIYVNTKRKTSGNFFICVSSPTLLSIKS